MAIKFLCPNGHPLSCGDDRAGKPGKCPKCGTQFVVPDAEEIAAASNGAKADKESAVVVAGSGVGGGAKAAADSSASASGSGSSSPVKPGSGVGQVAFPADQIVFLCPNGHRLNGPKSLQGRPGQCPHCGEKFRIPVYEEEAPQEPLEEELEEFPTEDLPEEEIPIGLTDESDLPDETEDLETFPDETAMTDEVDGKGATLLTGAIPPLPSGPSHQLFDVFSRLWSFKTEGTSVEILMKDGVTLRPTRYSPALSRQSFGVFAVADENGSYRLFTVAWESVARIEFHDLKDLPAGVFS